ncbi:uncharacterized protein LACBIDRAFT_296541 [Laccaria bicolor S238N-H82]|uniref:Predicted protein n=1 Tax=Laccaria bicolor (strain S238N-H82 / ATCC MYA-4686) TaxID=486041 RepID=B0D922_LACBS|nr:uncharacterized protein LACBIDRAFT_296541 [Laccaria bicolor S238N-H82]EDR09179.1 predicted protein [Laccaria bicolor S238N-H82]|eukprot:XP_001880492.1 predicted protein [Laccaria bicolor S238N-H82]
MPPRRAKRAKLESVVGTTPSTRDVVSLPNRTSNAVELPVELFLEILSYFPHAPVGLPRYGIDIRSAPPVFCFERTDLLRALSQTCRRWRLILLPLLWECLEVYPVRSREPVWNLWLARSLERKSKGLVRSPQHAAYVQCVRVRLSTAKVLPAFVSCLRALPNLHTLSIIFDHIEMTSSLKSAFEGRTFPSVRTAVVPNDAHSVLRSCPEVRRVICNLGDGSTLVSAMAKECREVEVIEGFQPDEKMMKRIVKAAPNLRGARFSRSITPAALLLLSSLKDLVNIELHTDVLSEAAIGNNARLADCIKIAKEMLRKREGTKSLIVSHFAYKHTWLHGWSKNIELD